MRPLLFFFWALISVGMVGCGSRNAGTAEKPAAGSVPSADQAGKPAASALPPSEVTKTPGTTLMNDSELGTPLQGLFVRPYFDDAGKQTQLAVSLGQEFAIHVFVETVEPYSTNAAQFRVEMPPGVRVTGTDEFAHKTVSIGQYSTNYMVAYDCQPVGRFCVITYNCVAEQEFRGGEVTVAAGIPEGGDSYLGFSTCNFEHAPAAGGTALLKKK